MSSVLVRMAPGIAQVPEQLRIVGDDVQIECAAAVLPARLRGA
jgi:hypothetical protein